MSLRRTHKKALDSFKGFVPAVADWHARAQVCLLEVNVMHKISLLCV